MSRFRRYAEESRRTIVRAKHEADRFGSLEIDPEHILLALISDPALISRTMDGVSGTDLRNTIAAHLPQRERNPLPHDLDLSRATREILDLAEHDADELGHEHIRDEHILLGLVESKGNFVCELLIRAGVSAANLRRRLEPPAS